MADRGRLPDHLHHYDAVVPMTVCDKDGKPTKIWHQIGVATPTKEGNVMVVLRSLPVSPGQELRIMLFPKDYQGEKL